MLLETIKLTKQKKKDISELIRICNEVDNLHGSPFLEQSLNYYLDIPCFFFYYEGEKLVSFLSLFFSCINEVEVSAYTHPEYRQKGYFSALFSKASTFFNSLSIEYILFMAEPHCMSSIKTLSCLHAEYLYSDYSMTLFRNSPYISSSSDFSLLYATESDLQTLSCIHAEAFNLPKDISYEFFTTTFSQDSVLCYKYLLKDTIIGFCNVQSNKSSLSLFGICIQKKYQNLGYGKLMLELLLNNLLLLQKPIQLEVNSSNIAALHLYQKLGFSTTICFDSYFIEN